MIRPSITPTQEDVQEGLVQFLRTIVPDNVLIIAAQPNMVAEPKEKNFVLISPILMRRLATNLDRYRDVVFTGSISGDVLTVTDVGHGEIIVPSLLFGVGIPIGTGIIDQIDASTYRLDSNLTLASSTLASGAKNVELDSEWTVQLDFHSEDYSSSELAQTISALFRDDIGTSFFSALDAPMNRIAPLYADDPARRPFVNDQKNYEWRWVVDAHLQVNQIIPVPQQFAAKVEIGLIEVDEFYAPT